MKINIYSITDVGKRRTNNEDAYLTSSIIVKNNQTNETDEIAIISVMDGMGGIEGGELASFEAGKAFFKSLYRNIFNTQLDNISCEFDVKFYGQEKNENINVKEYTESENSETNDKMKILSHIIDSSEYDKNNCKNMMFPVLDKAIEDSNNAVNSINEEERSPGTTLSSAFIFRDKVIITNIGDSRAYRYRKEKKIIGEKAILERVSKDHSYVQTLVDSGDITQDEAMHHPNKNIVTKCLGLNRNDKSDNYIYDLKKDDIYLISSDGLHDLVSDKTIKEIIEENENDIEMMAKTLVKEALDNGGYDNITIAIAKIL